MEVLGGDLPWRYSVETFGEDTRATQIWYEVNKLIYFFYIKDFFLNYQDEGSDNNIKGMVLIKQDTKAPVVSNSTTLCKFK